MRPGNKILIGVLTFAVVYVISLLLWIQVKPYYGYLLAQVGARPAGWTTGLKVETIRIDQKDVVVSFAGPVLTKQGLDEMVADLKIHVAQFSYNVPLTIALVAGLFPFFHWRKRYVLEISAILVFVHLIFIYLFCTQQLFYGFWKSGMRAHSSSFQQFILEFSWAFTQNLVIPFEPFLVAVYLWLRGREKSDSKTMQGVIKRKKKKVRQ